MTEPDGPADPSNGSGEVARFARAVAATATPLHLAAHPELAAGIEGLARRGVSQAVSDWWFTVGKACAGLAIDDTQCDTSDAGYATAAVMYARVLLDLPLADTDAVVEGVKLALAWEAGSRGCSLAAGPGV